MARLPYSLEKYELRRDRIATNGIELNVFDVGTGPLVLLLHGFPECWASRGPQMAFLLDRGYRVVAPEMRGYVESDAPQGVETYDEGPVVVIGHDWGCIVAWHTWNWTMHPCTWAWIAVTC